MSMTKTDAFDTFAAAMIRAHNDLPEPENAAERAVREMRETCGRIVKNAGERG